MFQLLQSAPSMHSAMFKVILYLVALKFSENFALGTVSKALASLLEGSYCTVIAYRLDQVTIQVSFKCSIQSLHSFEKNICDFS